MILGHDTDFIYLRDSYRMVTKHGATYIKSKDAYRIPISLEALTALSKDGYDMKKVDKLHEKLLDYRFWATRTKATPTVVDTRLRGYQNIDAEFIKSRNRAAVFNEQRTGKTPTTLIAARDKLGTGVIVCPAGLKLNWKREIKTWLGKDSIVIKGTPTKRKRLYEAISQGSDAIIIVSYETLRADLGTRFNPKEIDVLIVDEVHRLRNFKTKQSKAVLRLGLVSETVYALTGTPAVNHPSDVYGILKLLRPRKYTSYWQFVERYFGTMDGHFGKQILDLREDRSKEFTYMLYDMSVNRKRRDIMKWIPKVTKRTIELDFDSKQEKHYKRVLKDLVYGLEGEEKSVPNALAQLTRLRQICVDPALLELDGKSPKIEFIKEFINDNTGSIIIFSSFTSFLNNLADVVDDAVLLTGEQTQAEKQRNIDKFQFKQARVLLANIKAGGVGFTLDRADTIIFADRSYNPVDNEQAADRFIPTRKDVEYGAKQIIDLTIAGSIEEGINKLLKDKQNIISYVNTYIDNLGVKLGIL